MRDSLRFLLNGEPVELSGVDPRTTLLDWLRDSGRTQWHGQLWAWGWLSFFSVGGVGVQGTRIGLVDDRALRADLVVGVIKTSAGITGHLLRFPRARHGAEGIPAADPLDPEGNEAALALAEAAMREDLRKARGRYNWIAHAGALLVNTAHLLIIGLGYDDWLQGLQSAGIGLAFGELVLWSQPWEAESDWAEYEATFGPARTPP